MNNQEYWSQHSLSGQLLAPRVPCVYHKFVEALQEAGINILPTSKPRPLPSPPKPPNIVVPTPKPKPPR